MASPLAHETLVMLYWGVDPAPGWHNWLHKSTRQQRLCSRQSTARLMQR